jgi:predicted DNA-binding transcriptional regulator YafY
MNVITGEPNISLLVKNENIRAVSDSKYWYGFIEEEQIDDQTLRLRFANNELRGFATWIISSGSLAQVEEPEELKVILAEFISRIIENYQ